MDTFIYSDNVECLDCSTVNLDFAYSDHNPVAVSYTHLDVYKRQVARRVAAHRPDLIVITSPHAPLYRDGFFIALFLPVRMEGLCRWIY